MLSNTSARLLLRERLVLSQRAFAEVVIWRLPTPAPGSAHSFKYRLAYIADRRCVIRFDNELGKGDHKHVDGNESPYEFVGLDRLQHDFWCAIHQRRRGK
jgi:hypothetical protein